MAQLDSKVSQAGRKWGHLDPFLATWGILLRIFMHYYQVFMNIYAFLLKVNVKSSKIQKIAQKLLILHKKTEKARKSE